MILLLEGFALSSWYASGMMTSFAAPTLSQHFRDTLWLHLRGEPVVQRADSTASEVSHLSDPWMSCTTLEFCAIFECGEFGVDDWELPLPIMLMMLLVPESNNTCWARLNHVGADTVDCRKSWSSCLLVELRIACVPQAFWVFCQLLDHWSFCVCWVWMNVDNLALMIESSLFRSCWWCCSFRNQITLAEPG